MRIEAANRNLDHQRENLRSISYEWGQKFGAGALSLMTLKEFWETRTDDETGISIVSVRRPAEARTIQENEGVIFWIDADQDERYDRIQKASRGRVDDLVSPEEFRNQEKIEMNPNTDDPFVINMAGVREIADVHIWNDSPTGEEYKSRLVDTYEL